jgi:hypothetical protein
MLLANLFTDRVPSCLAFWRRGYGISLRRNRLLLPLLALLLSLAPVVPSWAAVTNYKFSDQPSVLAGDILVYRISPDSSRVVYLADLDTDDVFELYSVPLDGSDNPVKLNGSLASGGDVYGDFQISPDSSRVVYRALHAVGALELFSVPLDGSGSPVKLNGDLVSGGIVDRGFQISPDSSRVVYLADQDTDEVYELYSVPLDGSGSPVALNGSLVGGGDVQDTYGNAHFQISPDSSRVVYWADQDTDEVYELYSRPLDGSGSPVKLNGDLGATGDVGSAFQVFQVSADSSQVVYLADQDADDVVELYSRPLDGSGSPVKLNGSLVSGGGAYRFQVSPDSSRVVYWADQDTDEVYELYSVPLGGGSRVKLNGDLGVTGDVIDDLQISADSSRVVYRADQETDEVFELYGRPLDGSGSPVKLNGSLVSGGDVNSFQISADSSRVVYRANQDAHEIHELYSVPLDGSGSPVKLNGDLYHHIGNIVLLGTVQGDFQVSPDSSRVVYRADQDTDDVIELYSVPLNGGTPVKLNGILVSGGDVQADLMIGLMTGLVQISADSNRVVYLADQDVDDMVELYSRPLDGSGSSVKLLPIVGDVTSFQISPDGSRVVYLVDQRWDEVFELYSVPLDGRGSPVRLSRILAAGQNVTHFQISPDSSRVVFRADSWVDDDFFHLHSVPLDGSENQTILTSYYLDVASDFQISPDSSRVVFRADDNADGIVQLYSVWLNGSEDPVKLNGILAGGGDVDVGFQVSPDSSRVVYLSDQETNDVHELYSVPLDGSGSPVKLNGSLVLWGDVLSFQISADSSRVVYRADQDTDGVVELYSRPLDGSGSPVKLNGSLVGGGSVQSAFQISADSSRVVYLADQDADNVYELYSRPLDGSGSPVKLNGSLLVANGDVHSGFQISADSSRVVYRADSEADQVFQVYSRPLDGSGSPVELNGSLVSGGHVTDFRISADSSRVVYHADQDTDNVYELYSVPLDGSDGPVKLNGSLVDGGDVTAPFHISPDSRRVVYRADQDTDGVNELYSVSLDGSSSPIKLNGDLAGGGNVYFDLQFSPDSEVVVYRADQEIDEVIELYAATGFGSYTIFLPVILREL